MGRGRRAAYIAIIAAGLGLAGGAAWGIVPGELGHHGARIVPTDQPVLPVPATFDVGGASATP